jgi:hypothetical protein
MCGRMVSFHSIKYTIAGAGEIYAGSGKSLLGFRSCGKLSKHHFAAGRAPHHHGQDVSKSLKDPKTGYAKHRGETGRWSRYIRPREGYVCPVT